VLGSLDWYIDGNLEWGIEAIRQSDRISQHEARFGPDGAYSFLHLKEYRIVDFIFGVTDEVAPLSASSVSGKYICVQFGDSNLSARIHFANGKFKDVRLKA
jgi:hypothetical protein